MSVKLMHHRKTRQEIPYSEWFGAPVSFGNNALAIEIPRDAVSLRFRSGCEELASRQDVTALSYLSRLGNSDIVAQVQLAIIECLEETDTVNMLRVAERIGATSDRMHQLLNECGISYQKVLDQTRMYLAKIKLKDAALHITEIAFMLGFTDSANFSRAFKRMSGETPNSYRKRMLNGTDDARQMAN